MRTLSLVGLALALSALILFGRPPASSPTPEQGGIGNPQVAIATPDAEPLPMVRVGVTDLALVLRDRLTGEALALEVSIRASEAEPTSLTADATCDLSQFPNDAEISFALADGSMVCRPLASCLNREADRWVLTLPYYCRVIVLDTDGEAPNGEGTTFVCRVPNSDDSEQGEAEEKGPFAQPSTDMTAAGALNWRLRSHHAEVLLESPLRADYLLSASGRAALAIHLESGRAGYAECELIPGEEIRVLPAMRERPRIAGILLDSQARPVAGVKVRLAVALDLADYDFRPGDPHGLIALRRQGVLHQTLSRRLKTDEQGRFSAIAPHGSEYAVYVHALGGYAIWTTRSEASPRGSHEDIVLQLLDPSDASAITVTVLQPDGNPFAGVTVEAVVGSDVPFFRQWPRDLATGEDGKARLLGLEVGETICLIMRHPDFSGQAFSVLYFPVPASREILVNVPQDALKSEMVAVQ